MTLIRTWILTLTASALVIAAAQALMPEGSVKRVGQLIGGLILALALVQPLARLDYDTLLAQAVLLPAEGIRPETLQEQATAPWQTGIEETLNAYIAEKGRALGLSLQVQVACETGEDGVPVPRHVTVTGTISDAQQAALSDLLSRELGLEAAQQTYLQTDGEEAAP